MSTPEWWDIRHCEQRADHAGRVLYLCVGSPHVFCYSDGEYLGSETTVEAARKLCESGKRRDYVMEVLETTETAFKAAKLKIAKWEKKDKVEWSAPPEGDAEKLPQRIRQLDAKTFAVYRAGQYLGSEATLELAQKRAALGTRSDKNRVMQLWEQTHPDELPPFLQLTAEERAEYWRLHPPATKARPVVPPRAVGGAGVPVVPVTAVGGAVGVGQRRAGFASVRQGAHFLAHRNVTVGINQVREAEVELQTLATRLRRRADMRIDPVRHVVGHGIVVAVFGRVKQEEPLALVTGKIHVQHADQLRQAERMPVIHFLLNGGKRVRRVDGPRDKVGEQRKMVRTNGVLFRLPGILPFLFG